MQNWKQISQQTLEEFPIFTAKKVVRENPRNKKPHTLFLMEGLDWVNVIALTAKDEIILINQFRHGINQITLEIPGGCIDPGETPAATALRELKEETGFCGPKAELLGVVHANPAMQSMKAYTFLVRDAVKTCPQKLESGEDIEVIIKPFEEAFKLIETGHITHALVVAAFGLYRMKYQS
jgi:8-oxo-dGTP pyrophosphatase MutT (NUDIX family)